MGEEKDFIPCRQCSNSPTPGYLEEELKGDNGYSYRVLRKCECRVKFDKERVFLHTAKKANLRPSMLEYDPIQHYEGKLSIDSMRKVVRYGCSLDDVKFRTQSLYLYGPYGTQKTTLAQWLGKKAIERGLTPYYVIMRTLVNALVDSQYNDPDTSDAIKQEKAAVISNAAKSDLLIIDESFDLNKMTLYKSNYQLPFLDEFIRDRIDIKEKRIVFVSNVPVKGMDKAFGALQDLLARKISAAGAELHFRDNYQDARNDFNVVTDIFA
ncbi:MAG: ATP-binding protein [Actinobacteria bacterium]|nr:ATP-binding protein [Actinomycetota bacterium]MCA1806289.1 ATP-binding protein [Actinomycetota bacterium]